MLMRRGLLSPLRRGIRTAPPWPISNPGPASVLIPPQATADKGKYTIVLDMDETLLHSSDIRNADHSLKVVEVRIECVGDPLGPLPCAHLMLYTTIRPYASELVAELGPVAELILWTAGTAPYAKAAMPHVDPAGHIRHAIYRDPRWFSLNYVKDLRRLGRDMERTVIVDNSAAILPNRQHAVVVDDFFRNPCDTALERLRGLLLALIASGQSVPDYLAACRVAGLVAMYRGHYHLTGGALRLPSRLLDDVSVSENQSSPFDCNFFPLFTPMSAP
jgi:hypothetical protein